MPPDRKTAPRKPALLPNLDLGSTDTLLVFRLLMALVLTLFSVYAHLRPEQARWQPLISIAVYAFMSLALSLRERSRGELGEAGQFFSFLLDILAITSIVYWLDSDATDLYVAYFMVILMAVRGGGLRHNIAVGVVVILVYSWQLTRQNPSLNLLDPNIMLRFPFLLLVFGYSTLISQKLGQAEDDLRDAYTRLRAEKKRVDLVVQRMRSGAMLTDRAGRVLLSNETAERLLDIPLPVGADPREGFKPFSLDAGIDEILNGDADHSVLEAFRREPKPFYLQVDLTRLAPGGKSEPHSREEAWLWMLHDVTAQRLEGKLSRDFLSVISHKIRAPLTSLLGFSDLLSTKLAGKAAPEVTKAVERIQGHVGMLDALIGRLLRFVAITNDEPPGPEGRSTDCAAAIEQAAKSLLPRLEKAKAMVRVERSAGAWAAIDSDSLQSCLTELIDNAAKFHSGPNGEVTVGASQQGGEVRLWVKDNGPGIPPEERERIFQGFYQVESDFTGQVEGWGLGLAYVKAVMDRFGGRVALESKLGGGSTFTLKLPAAAPAPKPPAARK